MHEARKATAADVDAVAASLARAFEDDPLIDFIVPEKRRVERLQRLFADDLHRFYLAHDDVWTTGDCAGAALWAPPDKWRRSPWDVLRSGRTMLPVLGTRMVAASRAMAAIERSHPPGPHFYLGGLGTDPARQGTGVGSAVLTPVLQRCDEQGLGAYLESSKEKNIAFYNRHGFAVTRELRLPRGGPPIWLMWREPTVPQP